MDLAAQEAMRLFLDTWVVGPLVSILEWDEGAEPFEWDLGRDASASVARFLDEVLSTRARR